MVAFFGKAPVKSIFVSAFWEISTVSIEIRYVTGVILRSPYLL